MDTELNRKKKATIEILVCIYIVTGVQEKLCFFKIHYNPSLAYIAVQCECTVNPIGLYFFVQPIAAECWRGRGGKLSRIHEKKHNI